MRPNHALSEFKAAIIQIVHSLTTLGRTLRDARRSKGITQSRLAEHAGVTQPAISKIERGVSPPGIDTVLKLVAVLDLELVIQSKPETLPKAPWETD